VGRGAALLAVAAALAAALPAAGGEIHLDEQYPLRGRATRVEVVDDGGRPVAGAVVEALYRPNSQTSHRAALAPTDAAGATAWVPEDAGIVTLTARAPGAGDASPPLATTNVAVRYGGFPAPGVFIMLLAGVLLFGGAAAGMWMLLGAPPAVEPPST
jgi:hypothetical protein